MIKQAVSRSFAFVAIAALICVLMFIVTMDILKYCFGVDPVDSPSERDMRRNLGQKETKQPRHIVPLVYVNPPSVAPLFEPETVDTINHGYL
jgi:hypothetical protein